MTDLWAYLWVIFLIAIWYRRPSQIWEVPPPGRWFAIYKKTSWYEPESNPVCSISPWFALGLFSSFLPYLASLKYRLGHGTVSWNKLILPQVSLDCHIYHSNRRHPTTAFTDFHSRLFIYLEPPNWPSRCYRGHRVAALGLEHYDS